jgi:chromosome partitioning protein
MGRFTLGKIIAITNQKGGVGKTTTAVNLSACVAAQGKRVLLVDIDPQGNATSGLGKNDHDGPTVYDVLIGSAGAREAVVDTGFGPLSLIPTAIELAGAEIELVAVENRELLLKEALATLRDDYDFIFIDCSPSLGFTTVNILTAADSVLVPVQCEYLALEGLSKLLNTIKMVKSRLNPGLEIEGFVLTMYMRNRLNNQVVSEVREHFGELAYETIIQRNIRLGEAPSHGKPIMLYDASASGSTNYLSLAREFMKRNRK